MAPGFAAEDEEEAEVRAGAGWPGPRSWQVAEVSIWTPLALICLSRLRRAGERPASAAFAVAVGVKDGVGHRFGHDDANGVAIDGDPFQRVEHRAAGERDALRLGREVNVEQVGLGNLSHR